MAIGNSTDLDRAQTADLLELYPNASARRRRRRLPRSPKVLIGLTGLLAFLVLAVIGPWIAPYDPSQTFSTTVSFPQPPSAAHWLGTTQQQQDVFSQLLAGGRSTILVAFVAGLIATMLSVVVGVAAGYAGGLAGLLAFLVLAVIGPWIAPYDPSQTFSTTVSFPQPPSAAHWLGTTQQQQDVFSQLLAGGARSWSRSSPA